MIREYSPEIVLVTVIEVSEDADVDLKDIDGISVTEDLKNIEILYSNPRTEMAIKKKYTKVLRCVKGTKLATD